VASLLGVYYTLDNRIENNTTYNEHSVKIWADVDSRVTVLESSAVQTTTDLAWIKTTLLEIKQVLLSK